MAPLAIRTHSFTPTDLVPLRNTTRRRASAVVVRSAQPEPRTRSNEELLGAFFYGRAFAITLSKRLGAELLESIAAVSNRIATRESRIRSFQEEVVNLAQEEMLASAGFVSPSLAGSSGTEGSSSSSGTSSASLAGTVPDIQASVDDLRATVASCRALLQQMRQSGMSTPQQ